MSPRRGPPQHGSDLQGPAKLDELFVMTAWSNDALIKRYGSLDAAKQREEWLHRVGTLTERHGWRDWTRDYGLKLIDGADLEIE